VLWPDDDKYYPATITAKKRHFSQTSQNVVTLVYDDGDVETLDLSKEKFKLLSGGGSSGDSAGHDSTGENPVPGLSKVNVPETKKRIILEESEEEFVMEEPDSNGEDADGDASEFSEPGQSEEEDEEEDTTMVTDEDDVAISSSQKNATCSSTKRLRVTRTDNPYEKQRKRPATTTVGALTTSAANTKSIPSFITPPSSKRSSSLSQSNTNTTNAFSSFRLGNLDDGDRATKSTEVDTCRKNIFPGGQITPIAQARVPSPPTTTTVKPPLPEAGVVNPAGAHYHNHYTFLKPPKLRDIQNRLSTHPEYDPRTLHIDSNEMQRITKMTPAAQQWWDIKSRYADTLLLFKVGKFYEIFHMDADVAVQVLGFNYMKGCAAHAGFPEIGYGNFCERLVKAGHKVARVEQTETPDMLQQRKKKTRTGKKPQVVSREVCSIVSAGTRTFCYMDDIKGLEGVDGVLSSLGPLLTIKEVLVPATDTENDDDTVQPVCEYGIAIIDAARGVVTLGQFADDILRSRMNTLLTTFRPIEILVESGVAGASPTLLSMLKSAISTILPSCRLEKVQSTEYFPKSTAVDPEIRSKIERPNPEVQPWDVPKTISELHRKRYYPRSSRTNKVSVDGGLESGTSRWPEVIQMCIKGGADLALSAFGASLFYLQRGLIDDEILSMGIVEAYCPLDFQVDKNGPSDAADAKLREIVTEEYRTKDGIESPHNNVDKSSETSGSFSQIECNNIEQDIANEAQIDHMSLDGTTLANLEILSNLHSNDNSGSVWSKISFTKSPHGSRLLRAWLLRPLFRKTDIDRRADAVEELTSGACAVAMSEARALLGKCGDIERLLSRVHSMGGNGALEEGGHHPSERAVLYETATHTRRKVGDFSKLLYGLQAASQIPEIFSGDIQSGLLARIVRTKENGGFFPSNLITELDWFLTNFDCNLAAKGIWQPSSGIDEKFDYACAEIKRIKEDLEEYKVQMCSNVLTPSRLANSEWKYANTKDDSKDKYLIELPVSITNVPRDFTIRGKRGKGAKQINKYRTPVVERLVEQLENAIDIMKDGKARGMQLVFAKFDSMRSLWASVTQATAMLDALGSLAEASMQAGYCRPTIIDCPVGGGPSINVKQGRHPCVEFTHSGDDFIPNNLSLGEDIGDEHESRMLLLSGPNMGGKSTLLRQTCLIAVLAQIGCFVPAEECTLTPFDRIFTRLGASDRILLGQSTFFVELAETAAALRGATRRSLVIMDELGRGTSTFDGTAIAGATVKHLIERNRCLTLFATHYHSLLDDWKDKRYVRLGHMECIVGELEENSDDEPADNVADRNITFLYTLGEGSCPKSFGINVAHLAGLPSEVLLKAKDVSSSFEATINGIAEANSEGQINISAPLPLRKRLEAAVATNNLDEIERIWDKLQ